jgi:hypothetical protein
MSGFARRARDVEAAASGAGRGADRMKKGFSGMGPMFKRDAITLVGVRNAFLSLMIPGLLGFINILISSVSSLTAGMIGLAGAIGPVIGLLGALPGALAAAGGGIGVLVAGFAGIGEALKQYQTQQKNAAKTSATAAKQAQVDANRRVAAARRAREAQQALAEAEENASETARSNARAIADAQRSLADARLRARDVAVNSARAIENAERNLANAQESAAISQRGITEARRQAKQQIDDLRDSIRDLALEEEGASLSVEEARQRLQRVLNDPASTDLERRQARFAVKEAEARLQDVRDQQKDSTKELADAQKKGVEGSDVVVQARREEAEAAQRVVDAQRDLSDAHQDAKRNQQDAARGISDAQRGLADAQREAAQATRDSQRAIRDAQENIADLAATVETEAVPAVDQFKEAMKKLTPEAQAVVRQLIAMKPLLDQLRATAARGMLPGVLEFLRESVKLFPLFNTFVGQVAGRFGRFFSDIGEAMTTAGAMESWRNILGSTSRVIDITTDAAENLVYVLGDILEAGGPLTEWLAETVKGWTASWRAMTEGEEGQARLTAFFEDARKVASQLGRIIARTADALFNMGKAFRPVGQFLLDGLEKLVTRWDNWTKSVEGEEALEDWADRAIVTLGKMRDLIDRIFLAFRNISRKVNIDNIIDMFTTHLVPALETFMSIFTGELLNNMGIIAGNIADIIAAFGPDGAGVLGAFTEALVVLTGALADIVKHKAAVTIIGALIAALAAKKAVNVLATVTGVNNIAKSIATVQKRGGIGSGSGSKAARVAGGTASVIATSAGLGGFLPTRESSTRRAERRADRRRRAGATPRRAASRISDIPSAGPIITSTSRRTETARARRAEPARPSRPRRAAGAIGRGAGRATGAGATAAALGSLLPGPIGAVAAKLSILLTVLQLIGPAFAKIGKVLGSLFLPGLRMVASVVGNVVRALGGGFLRVLGLVGRLAVGLGKGIMTLGRIFGTVFLRIVSVVAKAMLLIGRAMLANPWILLIVALVAVVYLVVKYWDQIYGFIKKYVGIIFNWLKNNWKTIVKILMGPMGFLLVKIIENWGKIRAAITGFVNRIFGWLRANWKTIVKIVMGPLGFLLVKVIENWNAIRTAVVDRLTRLISWVSTNAKKFVGAVSTPFKNAKDKAIGFLKNLRSGTAEWVGKIGTALLALGDKAAKPISWIIDKVINGGIIKAYNWVAEKLGVKGIPNVPNPFKGSGGRSATRAAAELATGGIVPGTGHAGGGLLRGPGTGTSDSIMGINKRGVPTARVSAGEFVVREKVTRKNRRFLEDFNAGKIQIGDGHGYAEGGQVKGYATGGLVNFAGGVFTPEFAARLRAVHSRIPFSISQGGWRPWTPWSGTSHRGDAVDIGNPINDALVRALRQVSIAAWDRTGAGNWAPHIHGVPLPGAGEARGSAVWQAQDYLRGGDGLGGRDNSGIGILGGVAGVLFADMVKEFTNRVKKPLATLGQFKDFAMGKLAAAVPEKLAGFAKQKIKEAQKNFFGSDSLGGGGTSGDNQALGRQLMIQAGFGADQWPALRSLWQGESNWNHKARNPSSGAYGIPQSLPASKMAAAGADWETNPATQIRWGLSYIRERYGTPSAALSAWQSRNPHWYARGTSGASPGYSVVGERGPELVKFRGGEKVIPNHHLDGYHTGGFIKGVKPGIHARWIRALRAQLFMNSNSDYFGSDLKNWISKNTHAPGMNRGYEPNVTWLTRVANALKSSRSGLSITAAAKAAGIDPAHIWRSWTDTIHSGGKNLTFYQFMRGKGVPHAKYMTLSKSIGAYRDRRNADTRNLESLLGLPQDGLWQNEIRGPLSHVLDHAMGYRVGTHGHTAYDPTPWNSTQNALNSLLAEQARSNAINAEFDKLLALFDSWGLTYVKRKFTELGPADGLTNMRALSKNRTYATQYNTLLKAEYDRIDKENDPTEQQIEAFIKAVNAGVRVGLQGAANAASVSLDTGATLYDKITKEKRWGTTPISKWGPGSRLAMDVAQLRKLFRFANGGQVPGSGYSDTVMALLTPNEFVVRRDAAKAIERDAPGTLDYMNNYDRYAGGGFVAAGVDRPTLRTAHPSEYGRRVAASHANEHATKVVNNYFNTNVHNPIAEPAGVSVQKRVQRVARLGMLAGED